jgi:dual specificity phosphatase 12
MNFDADQIDERLWLGSLVAFENSAALERLNITHILSVLDNDLDRREEKRIHLQIRLADLPETDLLVEFDRCYEFIGNAIESDSQHSVLLHCQAGSDRYLHDKDIHSIALRCIT